MLNPITAINAHFDLNDEPVDTFTNRNGSIDHLHEPVHSNDLCE